MKLKKVTDLTGLNLLIYNPILPEGWETLDDIEKTLMFEKLFLLLNEDYQTECGNEIYDHVSALAWCEEDKDLPMLKKVRIFTQEQSSDILEFNPCCHQNYGYGRCHECNKLFKPRELYDILMRKKVTDYMPRPKVNHDNPYYILESWLKKSVGGPDDVQYVETLLTPDLPEGNRDNPVLLFEIWLKKSAGYPDYQNIRTPSDPETPEQVKKRFMQSYLRYCNSRLYGGELPNLIYPAVKIHLTKKELMRDFEEFVDEMQAIFFAQSPVMKNSEHGHVKTKSDGRIHPVDFTKLARYYQAYVMLKIGYDSGELLDNFYPFFTKVVNKKKVKLEDTQLELLAKDIKRAEALIRNARISDFPGAY